MSRMAAEHANPIPDPTDDHSAENTPVVSVAELQSSRYLRLVLSVVYQHESNGVPLTLSIPSGLIFGRAVHPVTWLREMSRQAEEMPMDHDPGAGADGRPTLTELFSRIADAELQEIDYAAATVDQMGSVYLTGATIVSPTLNGPPFMGQPSCWQVPLSQVGAWTLGIPSDIDRP